MDCARARSLLSEYTDGVLDKENKVDLERHLSSCAECGKELTALQALIQDLGSLPPVGPPTDFLRQFHKRMEQPSGLKRMMGKLFFPIRFKIPLQLAGAALAALLVFSVYTVQHEEYKVAETPQALKREETGEKRQVTRADKAVAPAEKPAARAVGLKKEEHPIELTLFLGKTAPVPQAAPPARAPAFEGKAADRELGTPRAAMQTAPAEQAEKVKEMDGPVRNIIEASQGKILSVENENQEGRPTFILAEVPSDKLPFLLEHLRQLGKVHVPPSIPSDEVHGPVKIRVRIVKGE